MLDRVSGFWPDGGRHGLGAARAERDIDPGDWYFKAHFHRDPVQPGSLGVEAIVQLLQWFMLEAGLADMPGAQFEPLASGRELGWRYRGQIVPGDRAMTATIELTQAQAACNGEAPLAACDGSLWVDGRRIYAVTGLAMRAVRPTAKNASRRPVGEGRMPPPAAWMPLPPAD
jgi:3-hydroxymyristoyl/3-hydroxydecanoyl-(acyl carrier protein) dehydratase